MPLVDIIIPAYNAEAFVAKALDSVLAQTIQDWRIILINDGSTDTTDTIIKSYRNALGEKFLYLTTENAGVSAARNLAIAHATAEFIAMLDADDIWRPHRLEATLKVFASEPTLGLVYGFVTRIDVHGRLLDTFATRHPHGEGNVARYLYMRSLDIPCSTVTCRRAAVLDAGGFDESMRATEDRDLWLRIAQRYKVGLAPEVVAYYRVSPQSATTDGNRMLRAQMYFFRKHRGTPDCGYKEFHAAMSWSYRQRAESMSDANEHGTALLSSFKSVWFNPVSLRSWKALAAITLRALGFRSGKPIDPTR